MHEMTAIDAAVLVAMGGWALWGRELRTRRTLGLVTLATLAYILAAQLLPNGLTLTGRVVSIVAVLWLLLFHSDWFVTRPVPRGFAAEYAEYLRRVRELAADRKAGASTPAEFTLALRRLVAQGAKLTPLDREWAGLKAKTTQHLESQLGRYEHAMAGLPVTDAALQVGEQEMTEIEAEYRRLARRKGSASA